MGRRRLGGWDIGTGAGVTACHQVTPFKDIVSRLENVVQIWSTHSIPSGLQVPHRESNIKQTDLPWTPYLADCYPQSPSTLVSVLGCHRARNDDGGWLDVRMVRRMLDTSLVEWDLQSGHSSSYSMTGQIFRMPSSQAVYCDPSLVRLVVILFSCYIQIFVNIFFLENY